MNKILSKRFFSIHMAIILLLTAIISNTNLFPTADAATDKNYPKLLGANNFQCKPSKEHPYPVVLIAGTSNTAQLAWKELSPQLKQAGYCVFAPNLGYEKINSTLMQRYYKEETFPYRGNIPTTARQLRTYINKVLKATKAKKVDLVGHSQGGGVLPRWYMQKLGGAKFVNTLIGIVPVNKGITAMGDGTLGKLIAMFPRETQDQLVEDAMGTAGREQMLGSPLMQQYDKFPGRIPGVKMVVIATKYDDANVPWDKNTFLPGATNISLQKLCPNNKANHAGTTHDRLTRELVLKYLGNNPNKSVKCFS